ncbi:hypothetical protein Pdw03_5991 [Penicillium digitatum]|uniref:Uncharacterized protein n=1 Tax=Penicillium digitatum TaxID=36651 RepID=A0A7T6XW34_PENDI|nr:hypothetical protein Pdw03_5991 [Penicillium digitatum]
MNTLLIQCASSLIIYLHPENDTHSVGNEVSKLAAKLGFDNLGDGSSNYGWFTGLAKSVHRNQPTGHDHLGLPLKLQKSRERGINPTRFCGLVVCEM